MAAYSPRIIGATVGGLAMSVSLFASERSFLETILPPSQPLATIVRGLESTITSTEAGVTDKPAVLPSNPPAPTSSTAIQSCAIRGVVDTLEEKRVRATLSYGGRENPYVFDLPEMEAAGADYPGALFEIRVGPTLDYEIVHLMAEEEAARAAAPLPDLSFLDD